MSDAVTVVGTEPVAVVPVVTPVVAPEAKPKRAPRKAAEPKPEVTKAAPVVDAFVGFHIVDN